MAALKEIVSRYQNLKNEWSKQPSNLNKCGELLNQLKVIYFILLQFIITDYLYY